MPHTSIAQEPVRIQRLCVRASVDCTSFSLRSALRHLRDKTHPIDLTIDHTINHHFLTCRSVFAGNGTVHALVRMARSVDGLIGSRMRMMCRPQTIRYGQSLSVCCFTCSYVITDPNCKE